MIFAKTLAGLRIHSDIALPDLAEPDATSPEFGFVRIRIVDIEELISLRNRAADDRNFTLKLPGIGEFFVAGSRELRLVVGAGDRTPASGSRTPAWCGTKRKRHSTRSRG